jgi:uncharacterized protein YxeA
MKNLKALLGIAALVAVIGFSMSACSAIDEINDITDRVSSVSLSSTNLQMEVGDSRNLTATVRPSSARNKDVYWESSRPSVATVSNGGRVTAVGAGTAVITVTTEDGGFTADCSVTVTGGSSSHTHTYSTTWSYNSTQHWHECTAGDGATSNVGNHSGNPCSVCNYSSGGGGTRPAVPTGQGIVTRTSNSITIKWTGNTAAQGYYIYRDTDSNGTYTDRVATVYQSAGINLLFEYTDTGLKHNTRYNYRISAYNSAGESNKSGYTYDTTSNIVPTQLGIITRTSNSITIKWTGNAAAQGYYIYRDTDSNGNYTTRVATVSQSAGINLAFEYTDTGLKHNTRYNYKISAYNSDGESNKSGYTYDTTSNIVPTQLGIVSKTSNSITIKWTGNAAAQGYYIYRDTNVNGNYTDRVGTVLQSAGINQAFTWTNTGLASNTRYNYKISAYNSDGESNKSGYTYSTTDR